MTAGKDRHFFPGGNTALGFFSYYDQIASPDATRIMIAKGGPGVIPVTISGTHCQFVLGRLY